MKRLILIAALALCQQAEAMTNGCLVFAREYQGALEARNLLGYVTWTRIVRVTRWGDKGGHAYCVYALRNGDMYSYDVLHGSMRLATRSHNIKDVVWALRLNDIRTKKGKYLD